MEASAREDRGNAATTQNGGHAVREFELADDPEVQRIFLEGVMEMIPDTAFRGLKHHPESVLLYIALTTVCFVATGSWRVAGCVPLAVLCARYFYSRRVVLGYLERARRGDMGDIEAFYSKRPDSRLWVVTLEGRVAGLVAAVARHGGTVELRRMSVDRVCRQRGVAVALARRVLEFAAAQGASAVTVGTTAYTGAPHLLYRKLGFRCVGVTDGYATPGARGSMLERVFYRVRHHRYRLDLGGTGTQ